MKIGVNEIKKSPFQPRLEFDLEDLKGSIMKDGILVPLTVRKLHDHYYELIDGERRLLLARELGYKEVPCEVIKADDETADRMVWKVNTLRKNYKPKEKALHYKKHQEIGWSLRQIARDHSDYHHNVLAYLNALKLSAEYQELIWKGPLSVGHIQVLESDFNGGGSILPIESKLRIAEERGLSVAQFRDMEKPAKARSHERTIEAAQKEAEKIIPESEVKIETSEDYDKAAEALKKEAKKKREEAEAKLTPKEKVKLEAQKQKEKEEKDRKAEEKRKQEEALLQKKAKEIAKSKLLDDKKFREEVKEDLSKSDMEALEELEKDPILTPEDKKTMRILIENGEIRGKKQIEDTIGIYRKERKKGQKIIRDTGKTKEIGKHLEKIAKTATSLSNLIMALSAQFTLHPDHLQFIPRKEARQASLSLQSLALTIVELKETCDNVNKTEKQKQQVEAIDG